MEELDISAVGKKIERWRETWHVVSSDTIHFEQMCAPQMILLLYVQAMSLRIQILVDISLGTMLIHIIAYFNITC